MKKSVIFFSSILLAVFAIILFCHFSPSVSRVPFNPYLSLFYNKPASSWEEALPVGNGRLGAMVFGRPVHEKLQLNDITVWSGKPEPTADKPEAYKGLPEIRKALREDRFEDAQKLTEQFMLTNDTIDIYNSKYFGSYQTLGDLDINFNLDSSAITGYRRWLDLEKAVAGVEFKSGDNSFTRELFSSAADGVIAMRIRSVKNGAVSFSARLSRKFAAQTLFEAPNTLVMKGNTDYLGHKGNCDYEARVSIVTKNGTVSGLKDKLIVTAADEAIIYITCGTSYIADFGKNYKISVPYDSIKNNIKRAESKSFERLMLDHIAEYQGFFLRASFDLGQTKAYNLTTPERMTEFNNGKYDPGLLTLFYQYGRYLMISSSRPNNPLPSNSQGIWGDGFRLPWNCDYKSNINYEMSYWSTEASNLSDCHLPMIRYNSSLVKPGAKTARAYFNSPGWVLAMMTNAWGWTSPGGSVGWGAFFGAGGWVCQHLWEHYAYTQDKEYLKSVYPVMKGSCEFYLNALIEDKNGFLVTSPSTSPENAYKNGLNVDEGSTIELQIISDLFTNTIAAAKTLGTDDSFRAKLESARAKIRPMQIGKEGQLMEWSHDWDLEAPEIHHRHISHLFGLYPGKQISPSATPELAAAAKKTLEIRGDDGTGWSLAWKINFWARLMDGDHAYALITKQLNLVSTTTTTYSKGGGTYPNLFDAHPPFQIDGNFGYVSGVNEMLFQSQETYSSSEYPNTDLYIINLLPALPKVWESGSIKGVRARGGFELDVIWKSGKLKEVTIRNIKGKACKVTYGSKTVQFLINQGKSVTLNSELVEI
jgi:alpha-L-fucosidase 2